ncbi:MAG: DUF3037 domain-containing protein [Gemmatimonadales bacterium]|nr:DUF3037 domain-containing protein [Gemmatimonadales bacterium]
MAAAGDLLTTRRHDPVSERFHWLTAPRSDVLQTSPIHEGLCGDPGRALDMLYEEYVMEGRPPSPTPPGTAPESG